MSQDPNKHQPATLENGEPSASSGNTPVWLFALIAVLLYWGMQYLDLHGGGFSQTVYEPYYSEKMVANAQPQKNERDPVEEGKKVYELKGCVACHQASGLGLPGQFPPLAGSEWVLATGPNRIIRVLLQGLSGPVEVKGEKYSGALAMPQWKDVLTDQEIADVLSYSRNSWGNKAPIIKPAQVKAIRDKESARATAWTETEVKVTSESD